MNRAVINESIDMIFADGELSEKVVANYQLLVDSSNFKSVMRKHGKKVVVNYWLTTSSSTTPTTAKATLPCLCRATIFG